MSGLGVCGNEERIDCVILYEFERGVCLNVGMVALL